MTEAVISQMSEAGQKLLPELLALSPADRAFLLDALTLSLDSDHDPELLAKLQRRWEDILSGRVQPEPIESMMGRLREKYQ